MNAAIIAGGLLLVCGLLGSGLLLFQDAGSRRLAERLASVQGAAPLSRLGTAGGSTIRRAHQTRVKWLDQPLHWVGYNPDNPAQYSLPWPVVAILALAIGALVWQFGRSSTGTFLGAVSALGATLFSARALFAYQSRRYVGALLKQLPDAISLIVRGVSVGVPPAESIRTIASEIANPTGGEFTQVVGEVAVGTPVETAIWNIYGRTGLPEYSFLAVAIGLQQRSGGNLSDTLENLADIIRKRIAMAARARALAAESKLAAMILIALPFVAGAMLEIERPGYFDPLFATAQGNHLIKIIVVLMASGAGAPRHASDPVHPSMPVHRPSRPLDHHAFRRARSFPVINFNASRLVILLACAAAGCAQQAAVQTTTLQSMSEESRLHLAAVAEQSGADSLALNMYQEAASKSPSSVEAQARYAHALADAGHIDEASAVLAHAIKACGADPTLLAEHGRIALLIGQPAGALSDFQTILSKQPSNVRALVDRGIALDLLGHHPEAESSYRSALKTVPDDFGVQNNLALSLLLQGRAREAVDILQPLAQRPDADDRTRDNLAVATAALGSKATPSVGSSNAPSNAELVTFATAINRAKSAE